MPRDQCGIDRTSYERCADKLRTRRQSLVNLRRKPDRDRSFGFPDTNGWRILRRGRRSTKSKLYRSLVVHSTSILKVYPARISLTGLGATAPALEIYLPTTFRRPNR